MLQCTQQRERETGAGGGGGERDRVFTTQFMDSALHAVTEPTEHYSPWNNLLLETGRENRLKISFEEFCMFVLSNQALIDTDNSLT